MKKLLVIMFFLISFISVPLSVNARSISQYRKDLEALKQKQADIKSNSAAIQKQINDANARIREITQKATQTIKEKEETEKQIKELNVKIEEKQKQIKELLAFYQMSNGENFYLKFLFGSESFTDFIYRFSVIDQLTEANDKLVDEMNKLIEENKVKIKELEKQEAELKTLNVEMQKQVAKLGDQQSSLVEDSIDLDDQITHLQQNINRYVAEGCGEYQEISTCSSVPEDTGFIKPTAHGSITENYGWRGYVCPSCSSWHKGLDIAVREGTPIYAAAAGKVADMMIKYYCGGNIVSINHKVNGVSYTTVYKHLLTINVRVGEYVEKGQVIGTSGGGAGTSAWETCSTGGHLHFEMARGTFTATGDYSRYIQNIFDPREMIYFPAYGYSY